jgi:hypothetical protein
MINVYLDDVRPCPPGFVVARSAEDCKVVYGIIASGKYPLEIYVHSSSLIGRAQMVHELRAANQLGVSIHDGPMPSHILEVAATGESRNA